MLLDHIKPGILPKTPASRLVEPPGTASPAIIATRDAYTASPLAAANHPALVKSDPQTDGSQELAKRGVPRISANNRTSLYVDGKDAFPALIDMIRNAKHSLHFETMIWHNDETGRQIAQELVAARKRGVKVRVLVDSIGILTGIRSKDAQLVKWMREQGIEIFQFNPAILSRSGASVTHHKLYIADNERFMTGGMNIGNEYAHNWHDMLIQIEGPATVTANREFATNWQRRTGQALTIPPAPPPKPDAAPAVSAVGFAVTDPVGQRFELREVTTKLIRSAKHSIRIQMPYNSDDTLMAELKAAAQRGVKVEYLMPGAINDEFAFGILNKREAEQLTKVGITVRYFDGASGDTSQRNRFSHLKMMLVDDTVTAIGSGNADHRTFHDNHEINSYVADPAFIQSLRQSVWDPDWAAARPAIPERSKVKRAAARVFEALDSLL